jgi:predicted Fe-Mo cluster-binding NifX family protein
MKIALATDGKNLEAEVVRHFGWGKNYLIYNTETKEFQIHPNPEASGKKEFPPEFLNRLGVNVVIVFSLGPKAFDKFKRFGIKLYEAIDKNIAENIKEFQKGNLSSLEETLPFY